MTTRKGLRSQIIGSAVALAIVGLFVGVLPLVASSLPDPNKLVAGERYELGNGVSIIPADGWSRDPASDPLLFVILIKSKTRMIFAAPLKHGLTMEDTLQATITGLNTDTTTHWQVNDMSFFATDAGLRVGTVTGHAPNDAVDNWVVSDGTHMVTIVATSSHTSWTALHTEMDGIIRSLEIK